MTDHEGGWAAAYGVTKCPVGHAYLTHRFGQCPRCEMKTVFGTDDMREIIRMLRRRLTPEQRRELAAHLSYDMN